MSNVSNIIFQIFFNNCDGRLILNLLNIKVFVKIILLTLDIGHLNPHQTTSVIGHMMLNYLALNPTVNYRMNYLTKIVPYPWKVDV